MLDRLVLRELPLPDAVRRGLAAVDGSVARVVALLGLLDDFSLTFSVMEPRPGP